MLLQLKYISIYIFYHNFFLCIFFFLTPTDVLETYYRPTSFMRLSLTSCQPLFEELLLLLQPLSLLTFNLDLLFQHHHLDPSSPTLTPASHTSEIYSPPNEDFSFHLSPRAFPIKWPSSWKCVRARPWQFGFRHQS